MSESIEKIIWIVDDDKRQLETSVATFQKLVAKYVDIQVMGMYALPHVEDYLEYLNDSRTVCLIIDQRLKESGVADYTGIELATYLRAVNDKIPIYILTNYAHVVDEFTEGEWNVEDIISKRDIGDSDRMRVIVERLLRRINVQIYTADERDRRFRDLLRKSLDEELTQEEFRELEDLRFVRATGILASEIPLITGLNEAIEALENMSKRVSKDSPEDDS